MHQNDTHPRRFITLNDGTDALVDPENFPNLSGYSWRHMTSNGKSYAQATINQQTVLMHRLILGLSYKDRRVVDHINGDGLDNRKSNLRIATHAQNLWNASKTKHNTSGFKGVQRKRDKWCMEIACNGERVRKGGFVTPEDAARAYDAYAKKLHGEFARLNFPDGE